MRRLAPALLVFLAILAACGGGSGKPQATQTRPAATPGGSAMLPLRPDQSAIYIVNADGTGLRQLFDSGDYSNSALSPDGKRLAVASTNVPTQATTLFLLDIATGEREVVFTGDRAGVQFGGWSPDGRWLAYLRYANVETDSGLYLYDTRDRSTRRADTPGVSIAVWSPKSDAIFAESVYQVGVVYRVAVPSFEVRELVRGNLGYRAFGVSPDGSQIAVGSFDPSSETVSTIGTAKLTIVQADGSGRREIFSVHEEQGFGLGGIAWSPDGGRIAYTRLAFGQNNPSGTYAVDVASGQVNRLTKPDAGFDMEIDWSSDGAHALLLRYSCTQCDGAGSKAVLAPADGSGEVALPGTEEFLSGTSSWSPDGSRFAYGADKLYVARADGAQATAIVQFDAKNYAPIGWPDGDRIVFQTGAAAASAAYAARMDGSGFGLLYEGSGTLAPDGETVAGFDQEGIFIRTASAQVRHLRGEALQAVQPMAELVSSNLIWSPDSTLLAVTLGQHGDSGLAVASLDGEVKLLADKAGAIRWSPDSRRIAYWTDGAVWTVDALGGEPRRVANASQFGFDWSPDGQEIAIADPGRVTAAKADGSGKMRTLLETSLRQLIASDLRWSPDGKRIAVSSGRQLVIGEVDSGSVTEPVNAVIFGFEWADNHTVAYGAQPFQGEFASGIYLLDVTSSTRTALTYSSGRLHKVAGVLADGRVVFVSQFTL